MALARRKPAMNPAKLCSHGNLAQAEILSRGIRKTSLSTVHGTSDARGQRDSRIRAPIRAECFLYQFKDCSPILHYYLHPCLRSHLREIDSAETEACNEDVDAVAHRFVIGGVDGVCDGFRGVSVVPSVLHLGMSFFDSHFQRGMGHRERYEFLPVLLPGQPACRVELFVERCSRQGGE